MLWPTSQDYNEVVQNAATCFADPALKDGEVVLSAIGLPVPRSGSFADVYQIKGGDGKMWAIKCFTRKVTGLQERYALIDEHLSQAHLPFTVGFKYLTEGIRIRREWFPLLKMEWVEGFTLNEFVRDNIGKPHYLHSLMRMWAKLTARLREANIAHADLQHGNVLLVPADKPNKLGLKLIDYDGMWVPALAAKHPGEVGHPNYQHPLRLKDRLFNADVDRFPHLVIACALRATLIGGQALWDEFDSGDNLLFQAPDLSDPASAPIFKRLWDLKDDVLCTLLGRLALASRQPLVLAPWLDKILLDTAGPRLTDDQEAGVVQMLGVTPHFTAQEVLELPPDRVEAEAEFSDFNFNDDDDVKTTAVREILAKIKGPPPKEKAPRPPRDPATAEQTTRKSRRPWYIGGSVAVIALIGGVIAMTSGGKNPPPEQPPAVQNVAKNDPIKANGPDDKKDIKDKTDSPKVETPKDPPKVETPKDPPKIEPPELLPQPKEVAKVPEAKKPQEVATKNVPLTKPVVPIKELWKIAGKATLNGLAFTNDGAQVIASPPGGPNLIVYSAADGKQLDTVKPVNGKIESFAIGPDDRLIVSDESRKPVYWDLKKKELRLAFDKALNHTQSAALAGKINSVLLPGPTGEIDVHFLSDGARAETHKLPVARPIMSAACSPDGKCIVAVLESGEIFCKTAGAADFKLVDTFPGGGRRSVVLSPDAGHFAFIFEKLPIRIYETASGKLLMLLEGHKAEVVAAQFTPDGQFVVSISRDKTLRIWDLESGKQMQESPLPGEAFSLGISPDGRFAATATANADAIQVWRLPGFAARLVGLEMVALLALDPKPKDTVEKKKDPDPNGDALLKTSEALPDLITACQYSSDGKKIYAVTKKGTLHVLEAATLKEIGKPLDIGNGALWAVGVQRWGALADRLYLLNENRHVRRIDTDKPTAKPFDMDLDKLLESTTNIHRYRLVLSPDGNYLYVSDRDGKNEVVRPLKPAADPVPEFIPKNASRFRHLGYSPDGRYGYVSGSKHVHVWEKKINNFNQPIFSFDMTHDMDWMAISPESGIIVASEKTKIFGWNFLKDAKIWESPEAHGPGNIWMGAAIPKTPGLITTGGDNTIRVWDLKTGKEVVKWKIDKNPATLAVSPDGKFAAVALKPNNQITLWKVPVLGGKK